MPDPQTSDMRQMRYTDAALPLASARLSNLRIPRLNEFLDEDLCKNFFYFHIFLFSGFQA